ncbi:MAG: hypothetical protein A3D44_01895 [Candidatus Staskawiczbacteria bacterium RIFCSPHIGHO2_02_FULL_42_22]|uniref:Homing endonuclease LAGLIDADG domain-containing protein n=1 Tax=Candidatus Staskawiczbacteria bacterium RIFCSPHIGHO2_02_FULL_42_22 TaxID=1802207 RepID=A0A1G2I5Z1_9BACT|nr:MAG: hypothetical protein A3D44_01895 [Candidatus Staskawiczbacteria bacterium RIFCSPHIGHO2_02_FULL_42_22]
MAQEKFSITNLVNNDGCFDLQFRKDTRHERTGSPTYYRWKAQFIITTPKENIKTLEKVKKILGCGNVSLEKGQARFSVQKIDDIMESIIPYFTKNKLAEKKKKDFHLWQKAVGIIYGNKGIYLSKWQKHDLVHLMEIHKAMAKHKNKPRGSKWIDRAEEYIRNKF